MKISRKIIFTIIMFGMILFIKNTKVEAASASISANTLNPSQGQTVTVTGSVTAGAWNLQLSGNGQSKTIYGYTNQNANSSGSDSISFQAGAPGTKYVFSLTGGMTDINSNTEESVNKSITIEVIATTSGNDTTGGNTGSTGNNNSGNGTSNTASSNANLSNLGVTSYDFTGFKPWITSYNTTVPNNVTSVSIYAKVQASGATYRVSGNQNLDEGTNKVTITVTAPDGKTTKNYYIYVARQASGNDEVIPNVIDEQPEQENQEGQQDENTEEKEPLGLISIAIDENYEIYLEPEFKTDIYEYIINLKEDLDKIPLNAIPNRENAKIEILGNENLEEGENLITIKVTDETTNETVEYKITVNKMLTTQIEGKNTEENNNPQVITLFNHEIELKWLILGAVVLVIIIIIVIILIAKHIRHKRKMYDYNFNEEDDEEWNLNKNEDKKLEESIDNTENYQYEKDNNEEIDKKIKKIKSKGKHF